MRGDFRTWKKGVFGAKVTDLAVCANSSFSSPSVQPKQGDYKLLSHSDEIFCPFCATYVAHIDNPADEDWGEQWALAP